MCNLDNKPFPWKLSIFPFLELIFFIFANLASDFFLSFLLIIIASVFLSFSIHVFFHECVHSRDNFSFAINIINTLLLGLPFDGYRIHHFNHHTYANGSRDFSSTWKMENGKKKAYTPNQYMFGWLHQLSLATYETDPFDKTLGDMDKIKPRTHVQKLAIFLFLIVLLLIGTKSLVLYFILVYFGWAFSALHNYGQHPPIKDEPVCTYANKFYNSLFFNNGLHWEHHEKTWLGWQQLKLDKKSPRIAYAHLINPFCTARKYDKRR